MSSIFNAVDVAAGHWCVALARALLRLIPWPEYGLKSLQEIKKKIQYP